MKGQAGTPALGTRGDPAESPTPSPRAQSPGLCCRNGRGREAPEWWVIRVCGHEREEESGPQVHVGTSVLHSQCHQGRVGGGPARAPGGTEPGAPGARGRGEVRSLSLDLWRGGGEGVDRRVHNPGGRGPQPSGLFADPSGGCRLKDGRGGQGAARAKGTGAGPRGWKRRLRRPGPGGVRAPRAGSRRGSESGLRRPEGGSRGARGQGRRPPPRSTRRLCPLPRPGALPGPARDRRTYRPAPAPSQRRWTHPP